MVRARISRHQYLAPRALKTDNSYFRFKSLIKTNVKGAVNLPNLQQCKEASQAIFIITQDRTTEDLLVYRQSYINI